MVLILMVRHTPRLCDVNRYARRDLYSMGQHVTCPKCEFSFFGGHSHHTGASTCVCLACMELYHCPTKSEWGPVIGEDIQLFRVISFGKRKKTRTEFLPTGVTFTAEQGEAFQLGERTTYLVHYPIDSIACPVCNQAALCFGFQNGDVCPKCKTESVRIDQIEY